MTTGWASEFQKLGALRFPKALDAAQIACIAELFDPPDRPGRRLSASDLHGVVDLIAVDGAIGCIAAQLLGPEARPVRAILLDKSPAANWRLGWHQDRTIAVRERVEVSGFGPWSVKAGQLHVQPPHDITARMVTLRVHVDDVKIDNAPLEVVPRSHLLGRLDNEAVDQLASVQDKLVCTAEAGDIWAYSSAIVHASAEQRRPGRRRVLQLDYSADELPGGLRWARLLPSEPAEELGDVGTQRIEGIAALHHDRRRQA